MNGCTRFPSSTLYLDNIMSSGNLPNTNTTFHLYNNFFDNYDTDLSREFEIPDIIRDLQQPSGLYYRIYINEPEVADQNFMRSFSDAFEFLNQFRNCLFSMDITRLLAHYFMTGHLPQKFVTFCTEKMSNPNYSLQDYNKYSEESRQNLCTAFDQFTYKYFNRLITVTKVKKAIGKYSDGKTSYDLLQNFLACVNRNYPKVLLELSSQWVNCRIKRNKNSKGNKSPRNVLSTTKKICFYTNTLARLQILSLNDSSINKLIPTRTLLQIMKGEDIDGVVSIPFLKRDGNNITHEADNTVPGASFLNDVFRKNFLCKSDQSLPASKDPSVVAVDTLTQQILDEVNATNPDRNDPRQKFFLDIIDRIIALWKISTYNDALEISDLVLACKVVARESDLVTGMFLYGGIRSTNTANFGAKRGRSTRAHT